MCLDIYSQHTCAHINHREIFRCGRPIALACHQVVVMEEASTCFNCLPPLPENIPPPPQPVPFPIPIHIMANHQQPYVHYLNYNVPPQVVPICITPGGQVHTYNPAQPYPAQPQQGGLVYGLPAPQVQYQGYNFYPGHGFIATTLPPPIPGQPYQHGVPCYSWLTPNGPPTTFYMHPQQVAQGQAQVPLPPQPAPAAVPQQWQQNVIPPQGPPPPPPAAAVPWQQNFIPPQAQPQAQRQFTPQNMQDFQPRVVPVEILPNPIPGQPPIHHPIIGTNAHRMPALPAQAVRHNIFYINGNPCVQIRNPPPGQPIQLVPAPPGEVDNLPTIETQAAEAGAPLAPFAEGFVPEMRWVCIREEWQPHVHYVPLGQGAIGGPPPGAGRRLGGFNPLFGWDQGGLPPGFVSSREDFPLFGEEELGNGEGSSGGRMRVEVESVQVLDEDEVSSQTQTPPRAPGEFPAQSSQPSSSSPYQSSQQEEQTLNSNPTESAINTPLPLSPSHTPSIYHHQIVNPLSACANSILTIPSQTTTHNPTTKTKKRVRFIFPARSNTPSPSRSPHYSPSSHHSPVPQSPTSLVSTSHIIPHPENGIDDGNEGVEMEMESVELEVEGVEVEGVVYVNASTQTMPGSCLSRRSGRRVRFDIPVSVFVGGDGDEVFADGGVDVSGGDGLGLGIEGLGIEGGENECKDEEKEVVYVDAATQTSALTQTDRLVSSLPDVLSIDAKNVCDGKGKGKGELSEMYV